MQRAGDRLALTFPRNIAATDVTITVKDADNLSGRWTNLARSTAGASVAALIGGVGAIETGPGATRAVEVRDFYTISDPAHPQALHAAADRSAINRRSAEPWIN